MARIITGTVTNDQANKTITVKVETKRRHKIYDKQYKVTNKFHAHDESNQAKVGDTVEIVESKPIGKNKSWRLNKIVQKAER